MSDVEKLSDDNDTECLEPIKQRYLLCVGIICYQDQEGRRYLDQLWYKDLKEHLRYIKHLTLASPCQRGTIPTGLIPLDSDPLFDTVEFVDLPLAKGFATAVLQLPLTMALLWQAIQRADVVHSGVAGWPIPPGWLMTPMVKMLKKKYVIVVESAFWRLQPGAAVTFTSKLRADFSERMNRWCMDNTDLAVFTHDEYKESLLSHPERGHIIYCSWIDKDNILSHAEAQRVWRNKVSPEAKQLKILCAGRLTASKGILVLLEAMKLLDEAGISVKLDILGQGELREECDRASQISYKAIAIETLGTVPYGPPLFELMQSYHALIIPTISDEGHRVVYDAYSQSLPIIASNTVGLREIVQDGRTGVLIQPGDPAALADKLKWAAHNLNELESLGMYSLNIARTLTHQSMHQQRRQLILDTLHL
ncbi:MAG: glycosyltransferase [Oscillatoriophycideae cyanobacterium NC_groundwater_1537_Pr4_S-0.65um_50_18]|nr:glycosyltransferase [Oscillatoriophycideae cyanobacterium NC_groundwater_1537_Pr4_S-0.65um_50_18]